MTEIEGRQLERRAHQEHGAPRNGRMSADAAALFAAHIADFHARGHITLHCAEGWAAQLNADGHVAAGTLLLETLRAHNTARNLRVISGGAA